ncbi:hypothetical protein BY458DRAFT_530047 [Sporodiniella umbellata]|nr:hypothetical protein BY458DRAFT_530047 [Sporodiniella umbellata]
MVQLSAPLPAELIQKIGSYLARHDQWICQDVCREWRYLFTSLLYKQIEIDMGLDRWWDPLECHGKWVRSLTLKEESIEERDLVRLWDLCPNVVNLHIQIQVSQKIGFSELKCLTVLGALNVQITSVPSSLMHIELDLEQTDCVIRLLSACPRLHTLKLSSGRLTFATWTKIHQVCPQLKSLKIKQVCIQPEENSLLPWTAHNLQELELDSVQGWDCGLEFISNRCKQLRRLTVSLPEPETTLSDGLIRLATTCPLLNELHLTHVPLPLHFFELLDRAGNHLDQLTLGDASDRTLKCLGSLAFSSQRPHRLKLWGWASLVLGDQLDTVFSLVGQCQPSAFEFSMEHAGVLYSQIHLEKLLLLCSGLRSLVLSFVQLEKTTGPAQMSPLQSLSLHNCLIHPAWMDLLGQRFPQLTELELAQCSLMTGIPTDLKIHLPRHTLRSLVLNHIQPVYADHHRMRIQPMRLFCIQSKQKLKWIDHQGIPLLAPISLPSIFIECASIHELILAGLCVSA